MEKTRRKPEKHTVRRLLSYVFRHHKAAMTAVLVCILLSTLGSAAVSISLKFLLDDFILPMLHQTQPDFVPFYKAISVLGVIFLAGVSANLIQSRLMVVVGQGVLKRIRDEMFEHMQTLPIRYFDDHTTGDIMSLYTNDTDTLRQMITQSVPQVITSTLMVTVTFISMILLSPALTVIPIIMLGVLLGFTKFIGRRTGKYFGLQQKNVGRLTGFVEERMEGQRVVKVFNHEEQSVKEFDKINKAWCHSASNAHTYASIIGPVVGNIGNLQFIITAVVGGYFAINGWITLGAVASYLQFTKSFTQPFMQIGQQMNSIIMALAGAGRIFSMMDLPSETDEGKVTLVNACRDAKGDLMACSDRTGEWAWMRMTDGVAEYTPLRGEVEFHDMTFGYDPEQPVLKNLSLYAKPGQKLAFVGATGAGKTTITNLINRFYDVQDGSITYDGIDVRDIRKADLRRSLGIVLQDTHLFSGTIMDNIRYGKLDVTDDEVYAAAKLAHADAFIRMLPEGYDTMITGDGGELSQGQCQLLSIARAAVADPPVLILDEATSSIDTRTEQIVQRGMDNLMHGRTVFVIAHRLSTIRNSDAIMVLEHGKIIERGDHERLLAKKGVYWQLYTGALELD